MTTVYQHLAIVKAELTGALNGRIERAESLVKAGGVKPIDANTWEVASRSQPGQTHKVTWADGCWHCDCPDHLGTGHSPAALVAFGGGVQRTCQHILSAGCCYFAGEYPAPPAFDLAICTRKRPFTTGSEDYEILWYKRAGAEKVEPKGKKLTDSDILKALAKYSLVHTESHQNQVIRRYVLQVAQ